MIPCKKDIQVDRQTGLVAYHDPNTRSLQEIQMMIGLELHAQIDASRKLFSFSSRPTETSSAPPNLPYLDHFDYAVPGTLPSALSTEIVEKAVMAAHALGCTVHPVSRFERKHYTYADLPHGYQITQQSRPLATDGTVRYTTATASTSPDHPEFTCRVQRLQLEMDSGSTTTTTNTQQRHQLSRVNFNRAGAALLEIVLAPDLTSPVQAKSITEHIRKLLQHLQICPGHMEEGHFRADVNFNFPNLTPRTEIKNLNSLQQIEDACVYEAYRHVQEYIAMNDDHPKREETRSWNVLRQQTEWIRYKDEAQDYRFFMDPDLPPLVLTKDWIEALSIRLPELPQEILERLQRKNGLTLYQARILLDSDLVSVWDEILCLEDVVDKASQKWKDTLLQLFLNDFLALRKQKKVRMLSPKDWKELVDLIDGKEISHNMGKRLLKELCECLDESSSSSSKMPSPRVWMERKGYALIRDPVVLRTYVERVLQSDDLTEEVALYKIGSPQQQGKLMKLFMGQVMKECKGQAEPELLRHVLEDCLHE